MSGFLAFLLSCYCIISVLVVCEFIVKIINDEMFKDGFQVKHVIFFPSTVISLLVAAIWCILFIVVFVVIELIWKLFDIRLN